MNKVENSFIPTFTATEELVKTSTNQSLGYLGSQFFSDKKPSSTPKFSRGQVKLLGITDPSGGGHETAMTAVSKALEKVYKMQIERPFTHIPGEEKFNELQQQGHSQMLGYLTQLQSLVELFLCPTIIRPKILKLIEEYDPDIIISVVPLANYMTHELAAKKGKAVLVIPTDLKCEQFFHFVKNPGPNFYVGLAFEDKKLIQYLCKEHGILRENIFVIGYPVRKAFEKVNPESDLILKTRDQEIVHDFNIANNDRLIIIMMGARGMGDVIIEMATAIAQSEKKLTYNVHVIALCGSNEELKKQAAKIEEVKSNHHVFIHAIGKKDDYYISALMRFRNAVLISKPGGATVNEAYATAIYTLFYSQYAKNVDWEMGNMRNGIENGLGEEIEMDRFSDQVFNALEKPRPKITDCPARDFQKNLQKALEAILSRPKETQEIASPFSAHKFFQKQIKFLNNKLNPLERIKAKIIRRESKAMLSELLANPQTRDLLKGIIVKKEITANHLSILSKLLSEDSPSLYNLAFPKEKNLFKKIENKVVRHVLKHSSFDNTLQHTIHYLPQAFLNEDIFRLVGKFILEENLHLDEIFEKINKYCENINEISDLFTKQQKLKNGKSSLKEKVFLKVTKREMKEAIYNLMHQPEIREILRSVFVKKQITPESIKALLGLAQIFTTNPDHIEEEVYKILFTTKDKSPLRKLENLGIQYFLKHAPKEQRKKGINESLKLAPQALFSKEMKDLINEFCQEENIDTSHLDSLFSWANSSKEEE